VRKLLLTLCVWGVVLAAAGLGGAMGVGHAAESATEWQYTPPSLGAADAPVTIIEFGDFQCPNCALFARNVKPEIIAQYIETGKVRFEFRHFPIIDPLNSFPAAHASVCAHAQGKFWEYHDFLYSEGRGAITDENLTAGAARLGLDTDAFAACLSDPAYGQIVSEDFRQGRELRITGTPTYFVNGRRVVGSHPFSLWTQFIEVLLAESNS